MRNRFVSFTEYSDFGAFLPQLRGIFDSKYTVVKVLISSLSFYSYLPFYFSGVYPTNEWSEGRETSALLHIPYDLSLVYPSFSVYFTCENIFLHK